MFKVTMSSLENNFSSKQKLNKKKRENFSFNKNLTKDTVSFSGGPIEVTGVKVKMFVPVLVKNALENIAQGSEKIPYALNLAAKRDKNTARIVDFMLEETGVPIMEALKMKDVKKAEIIRKNLGKMKGKFLDIIKT
jgi:hypothetical protein